MKDEKKIIEDTNPDGLRIYFYYLRNIQNAPIVTVCIAFDEEHYYRGVSLCSFKDNPVKEEIYV